ncbi:MULTISPECIES: hydantoinase/oxoprolinase family protein [Cupriavidus]|uniref:hydantoinase/oxoprolinase family protein n=1 Tax=Cupriavidus sp. DF5525 TaxID=3160989 RepID=UPI0003B0FED2|nr:hypothetical protein N234_32945 [Ralstonia pickettii DTP0602]
MGTNTQNIRAGVDIGGTFTDVALECDGKIYTAKILTDYEMPERAIVAGLKAAAREAAIAVAQIGTIIHGTTLATNALIERRGAHTAFITSEGFRDVIEMRTEGRFEQYDLGIELPAPLIPRNDRFTVAGRLDARGRELVPLAQAGVDQVIRKLRAGEYESVAIGLMHSYRNDAHERAVRDLIAQALPDIAISISSEVSPQIREFERFNTVCANAYVKPLISSYLNRLTDALAREGMRCPLYLIHSGGGLMSLRSAAEFPVRLLESGPAGGAIFASHIATRHALPNVVSFDMGGTTAKICLIEDQVPKTGRVFEVARTYRFKKGSGMPISIPVIEMIEIGAGGGSIAHVDDLKQVRVGPASAGSEPGPACYGRGGERPTVTDADLVLGKLDPGRFAGGSIQLDRAASELALANDIAGPLDSEPLQAAHAVAEVVDENMANAARMHAVENGRDLEQYTMIAYGGAAPLHAVRLCEKLGIRRLLVPAGAGVGSAIGFLRAPFSYESLRSAVMRLGEFDAGTVTGLLGQMEAEVSSFLRDAGYQGDTIRELRAFMRYAGQGWEIPIPVDIERFDAASAATLRDRFVSSYIELFGHAVDGLDVEVVSWSLSLRTGRNAPQRVPDGSGQAPLGAAATPPMAWRDVFDAKTGQQHRCAIYERGQLVQSVGIDGPLIVVERETSTYVSPDYRVTRLQDDSLLIERRN